MLFKILLSKGPCDFDCPETAQYFGQILAKFHKNIEISLKFLRGAEIGAHARDKNGKLHARKGIPFFELVRMEKERAVLKIRVTAKTGGERRRKKHADPLTRCSDSRIYGLA